MKIVLALVALFALTVPAFAGSDGHGTNTPDRGAVKDTVNQVDAAVLATGERVKDLSNMANPL